MTTCAISPTCRWSMEGECSDGAAASPTMSGEQKGAESPVSGCPGSPPPPSPTAAAAHTGRRRLAQKRVVTVPLADVSAPRPKGAGEGNTPTDSWAWRKYGQKPIKGSPYPRAYYRCSSSKGCPARKQVERSRADPAMVVVTYSFEHSHSGTVPRAQGRQSHQKPKSRPGPREPVEEAEPEDTLAAGAAAPAMEVHDEFRWLYDFVSVASASPSDEAMLYGPIFADAVDTAMLLLPEDGGEVVGGGGGEGGDEDALFAGLDELPECATVFRRRAGWVER